LKRIQQILALLIICLLCSSLVLTVSAHPGKTDGSGGHTDRSTGEYHYHHGYPAHDHYDMDGDGDIDCPYEFDDQTGANSGGNSDSSNSAKDKANTSPLVTDSMVNPAPTINDKKEGEEMPPWGTWTIAILGIVSVILFLVNRSQNNQIDMQDKKIRSLEDTCNEFRTTLKKRNDEIELLNETKQQYKFEAIHARKRAEGMVSIREAEIAILIKKLSILQSKNNELYKKLPLLKTEPPEQEYEIIDIPDEVYFVQGNIPVKGEVTVNKPFGDFTVFVAHHGKKYHIDPYCGGSPSLDAVHLYDILGSKSPCFRCALTYASHNPRTMPDWYQKTKALKKHETYPEQLTISRLQGYETIDNWE